MTINYTNYNNKTVYVKMEQVQTNKEVYNKTVYVKTEGQTKTKNSLSEDGRRTNKNSLCEDGTRTNKQGIVQEDKMGKGK